MAEQAKRTVRKGRIYHVKVAEANYRTFIWEAGSGFCGRVEDQPQVELCKGRTVLAVRNQLCAALAVTLVPKH
jgi:hypothetical protein